jgi:nucleoside-diphosphate-sugar epimerase
VNLVAHDTELTPAGDHWPAVTAFNSSSDTRISSGRSRWSVSSIQRSNAILKTAMAASAARLATGSVTPNRWPAVHRHDSARLLRLALEEAPAGSTLHAVADEGVPIRDIAEVIGRHLELPVLSISPEEAQEHFAWLAGFLAADSPASSELTRELLGWQPTHRGLIDDLDQGSYFRQARAGAA